MINLQFKTNSLKIGSSVPSISLNYGRNLAKRPFAGSEKRNSCRFSFAMPRVFTFDILPALVNLQGGESKGNLSEEPTCTRTNISRSTHTRSRKMHDFLSFKGDNVEWIFQINNIWKRRIEQSFHDCGPVRFSWTWCLDKGIKLLHVLKQVNMKEMISSLFAQPSLLRLKWWYLIKQQHMKMTKVSTINDNYEYFYIWLYQI